MIRRLAFLVPVIALAVVIPATPGLAATDFQGTVSPGTPFAWTGNLFVAANAGDPSECGKDPTNYCDTALILYNLPVPDSALPPPSTEPQTVTVEGTASVAIGNYFPFPDCDFDLYVYLSDDQGTAGDEIGSSTGFVGEQEKVTFTLTSTATVNPDGSVVRQESTYILAKVAYFIALASNYQGTAKIL